MKKEFTINEEGEDAAINGDVSYYCQIGSLSQRWVFRMVHCFSIESGLDLDLMTRIKSDDGPGKHKVTHKLGIKLGSHDSQLTPTASERATSLGNLLG